jgi:opacity protein-like surface antigen
MIKKLLILVGLLIGTNSMANNHFVGVDYLQMNTSISKQIRIKHNYTTISDTTDTENYNANRNRNLKIGLNNNKKGRGYIKFGDLYNKHGIKYFSLSLNADYYINKYSIFTPYIGYGYGYGKLTMIHNKSKKSNYCEEGTARVGSMIDIKDNLKAEIGYQYTHLSTKISFDYIIDDYKYYTETEKTIIKGFYISLNYGF